MIIDWLLETRVGNNASHTIGGTKIRFAIMLTMGSGRRWRSDHSYTIRYPDKVNAALMQSKWVAVKWKLNERSWRNRMR